MAWSEEDIVGALVRVGAKGLTRAALAKVISAPGGSKQFSCAITRLKSRGVIRGPFRIGRLSLYFETRSAPTREQSESRIEDLLRRAGTRVTTRSNLDKGMKGIVQSLYNDAISALKAEGKIAELRSARGGRLYVHRDAIIELLRVESRHDGDDKPPQRVTLEDVRRAYKAIKLQQGGISGVRIFDVLNHLSATKEQIHDLLRRERQKGRISLHPPSTVNVPREVMEAGIEDEGEPHPLVTFVMLE